jgi:hypothetical protein
MRLTHVLHLPTITKEISWGRWQRRASTLGRYSPDFVDLFYNHGCNEVSPILHASRWISTSVFSSNQRPQMGEKLLCRAVVSSRVTVSQCTRSQYVHICQLMYIFRFQYLYYTIWDIARMWRTIMHITVLEHDRSRPPCHFECATSANASLDTRYPYLECPQKCGW